MVPSALRSPSFSKDESVKWISMFLSSETFKLRTDDANLRRTVYRGQTISKMRIND